MHNTTASVAAPVSEFLASFEVYDVDSLGVVTAATQASDFKQLVQSLGLSGLPLIVTDSERLPPGVAAVLLFQVYRDGEIVSVVALAASDRDSALGVFEIWEPVGEFDEVRLAQGYYSKLDRFQNVSAYIRFEKGSGLPGSVWHRRRAVVHNDLPNHPGFLRAAGASAEALTTAVGIPIFDDDFVASIVLISSAKSPLARGIEIWTPDGDGFVLLEGSYPSLDASFSLSSGTRLESGEGLPAMARQHGGACVSSDVSVFAAGREIAAGLATGHRALALPYYDGSLLTSVVVLLF
ncbi:MAG TPA: GAF domain-containing protein [Planctomycetaceae bacterium]|nr:GAF domain-containing protein [Planctomycetaceae bacterium]